MERRMQRELTALQRRVEVWRRRGGGRGCRIPEVLWKEAVRVAHVAGVYATARALRFNYKGLKQRVGEAAAMPSCNERVGGFVALEMPPFKVTAKVVVDLVSRDGEQMRIDVSSASGLDVVALAQAFWKRQS